MTSARQSAVRRFLGFVCLLIIAAALIALLGWPPTRRIAGPAGVTAMLAGIVVSLSASILGAIPVLRAALRVSPAPPFAMLASLAVRFVFALAAAGYVILNQLVAGVPFVLWLGISYLLLLPLDVVYALRSNRPGVQSDPPDGKPAT